MPFTVQHLVEGCNEPVTLSPKDRARKALDLMSRNNYSQLPVIATDKRPLGLVTSDSILSALSHFQVNIDDLRVSAAMVKHREYTFEDDLSELLHALTETQAVLIVDQQNRLTGIVTSYDSTEYFRRRAEDMMYVEDIEGSIKDHIRAVFTDLTTGEVNEDELRLAVSEIRSPEEAEAHKRVREVLGRYLALVNGGSSGLDRALLTKTLSEHPVVRSQAKDFDRLGFSDYVRLLLHPEKKARLESVFGLPPKAIEELLDRVREIRNTLAHFRGDITQEQREQLRFCVDWLRQHQPPTFIASTHLPLQVMGPHLQGVASGLPSLEALAADEEIGPVDEEEMSSGSRYAPLALLLQRQPRRVEKLQLSFSDMEQILGSKLPQAARAHRSWWANDPVAHLHSQQWLDAGWRTTGINMTEERVVFARIEGRQIAKISFFGALLAELRREQVPSGNTNPDGSDRYILEGLPEGSLSFTFLMFSFARNRRFRVELYIDSPGKDQAANKRVFDALYAQKEEIEAEMGESLSWERLDDKEASRIALYHEGSITDTEEDLRELRRWAADAMARLRSTMKERVAKVAPPR